jgi:hypothetical protein
VIGTTLIVVEFRGRIRGIPSRRRSEASTAISQSRRAAKLRYSQWSGDPTAGRPSMARPWAAGSARHLPINNRCTAATYGMSAEVLQGLHIH